MYFFTFLYFKSTLLQQGFPERCFEYQKTNLFFQFVHDFFSVGIFFVI